ncbi:TPA: hypothetical protein ACIAJP_000950 [Staphylococcus aureus]
MKKLIGLILVSTLALTACGEKEKTKKEENKKSQTQKHKDIKPKNHQEEPKKVEDKNRPNNAQNNSSNQNPTSNNAGNLSQWEQNRANELKSNPNLTIIKNGLQKIRHKLKHELTAQEWLMTPVNRLKK